MIVRRINARGVEVVMDVGFHPLRAPPPRGPVACGDPRACSRCGTVNRDTVVRLAEDVVKAWASRCCCGAEGCE